MLSFGCCYHLVVVIIWLLLSFGCCYHLDNVIIRLLSFGCCYHLDNVIIALLLLAYCYQTNVGPKITFSIRCTRVENLGEGVPEVFAKISKGGQVFQEKVPGGGPPISGFIAFLITSVLKLVWGGLYLPYPNLT
jgi:hypothetical protein